VFAAGFLVLLLRRQIRALSPLTSWPCSCWAACKGALGWFMVRERPGRADLIVSQYRLATHFLAAARDLFVHAVDCSDAAAPAPADGTARRLRPASCWSSRGALVRHLTFGAFVAGLNGGLVYNSFPLHGRALVPGDAFQTAWSPSRIR
jgi:cytochrome c oxidase assembly protein subunit 15